MIFKNRNETVLTISQKKYFTIRSKINKDVHNEILLSGMYYY